MRSSVLAVALVFSCVSSFGQDVDTDGKELHVKCHTEEMERAYREAHPEHVHEMEQNALELEMFTREFISSNQAKDNEVYTIPVVFHIVHNNGPENISPEQVQDAIRVLNEDFSAQNLGASAVRPEFTDLVADVGIRFALAQRDPDGNCTNGIIRTQSTLTYEGGENLKDDAISPIWDRSSYLNVWVCETIGSGAAGYTRYPGSVAGGFGAQIDGIVIRSDYVGAIGTSSPNRSHTMTHEVGHWINLPHTWGSTNEPELESNCGSDDGVDDTPATIGWTSCVLSGESCGSLDNVENYMEYSYCSKMFTLGQADRMIAALNSSTASRSSLWTEENLIETGVDLEPEICAAEIAVDRKTVCVGEAVNFQDYSYNGVVSRIWTFDGGEPATSTEEFQSVVYTQPGTYAVTLAASDGNDEVSVIEESFITVLDTAQTALPFFEGFEGEDVVNGEESIWYTENATGNIDWEVTDAAAYSGDHSVYVHGRQNGEGEVEYMLSKTFELEGIEENAALSFKYACQRRNWQSNDVLRVWISKNCGEFWSLRKTIDDDELYSVPGNNTGEFVPTSQDQWGEVSIENIVSVFLNNNFRVRFEFISENGNNIYIDDINLEDISAPTFTSDAQFEEGVSIFPNPASDMVQISIDGFGDAEQMDIILRDIAGREIETLYSGYIGSSKTIYTDVSTLAKGMYFVEFSLGDRKYTKKVMIQR